jgi:hypothetical protein
MMAFQSVRRRCAVATLLAAANHMTMNMHGDDGQMTRLAIRPHPRRGHQRKERRSELKELSKMGPLTILRFIGWFWGETQ